MSALHGLKTRLFPKGVKRTVNRTLSRVTRRTTARTLARALGDLGIEAGAQLCVHSRLSSLGYLVGGPGAVIEAMRMAVPGATVMMPTFTFGGSCEEYLASDPVYDRTRSRSASGLLTETLWRTPGAVRSFHPTHPCAALGPQAATLVDGSERAVTPFGDDSTYGRFAASDNAVLLLLATNNTSLVHRFQEEAETPNLFLPGRFTARGLDAAGDVATYELKVHRPKLPLFVAMRGDTSDAREYVWMPDYCLPAPADEMPRIRGRVRSERALRFILDRHRDLVNEGVVRVRPFRDSELIAIRVGPYKERIVRDLRANYEEFAADYELAKLEQLAADNRLSRT